MTLSADFLAAAGSVTGRDHRRAQRDGQDGHAIVAADEIVVAIVTDGCSSGRASEIGARIGAAWIAALVAQCFRGRRGAGGAHTAQVAATEVTRELLVRLEVLARSLDPDGDVSPARVEDALLFGFLAAVVTHETTIVFGIGDGIVAVDGVVTILDPGPHNAPPYAAYGLFGRHLEPRIHFVGPTASVDVIAVATDGIAPLAGDAHDGHDDSLVAIASDLRYVKNPSLLRKRLVVLSDRGVFSDDATLAVVRRRSSR
jgi:hypothetical protein